jgi:hypothetical protein
VTPGDPLAVGARELGQADGPAGRLVKPEQPVVEGHPRDQRKDALGGAERHLRPGRIAPRSDERAPPQHDAAGPSPVQERADDLSVGDVGHRRRQVRLDVLGAGHRSVGLVSDGALQAGSIHAGPGVAEVDATLHDQGAG